ncbi:SRPBCC domain-containing protein [Paenibacillus dendritiformis]|uniref:SRPBCC domain-containing protein n=1 Tax=Paenibacillus dendritiformis TaxID=130049 RepID=UPI0018CF337E|nr:SRPBCC domain-containing protein [Paenibacillus dendritiformis]
MVGSQCREAIASNTGQAWEEWIDQLERGVDPAWSHERIVRHIAGEYDVSPEWSDMLALLYGQKLGRVPVGQTASAGVQIGVRRTMPVSKDKAWTFLLSPEGLPCWLGTLPSLPLQVRLEYVTEEGTRGQIRSVIPEQKLRLTWQPQGWEHPSTLQVYVLSKSPGKTTISIHQEKLDDIYMRELMRRTGKRRWIVYNPGLSYESPIISPAHCRSVLYASIVSLHTIKGAMDANMTDESSR